LTQQKRTLLGTIKCTPCKASAIVNAIYNYTYDKSSFVGAYSPKFTCDGDEQRLHCRRWQVGRWTLMTISKNWWWLGATTVCLHAKRLYVMLKKRTSSFCPGIPFSVCGQFTFTFDTPLWYPKWYPLTHTVTVCIIISSRVFSSGSHTPSKFVAVNYIIGWEWPRHLVIVSDIECETIQLLGLVLHKLWKGLHHTLHHCYSHHCRRRYESCPIEDFPPTHWLN